MAPKFLCCNLITTGYAVASVWIFLALLTYFVQETFFLNIYQFILDRHRTFHQQIDRRTFRNVQETLIRVKAIETFINVLVAVFLLIGTYKRHRVFVLPWLVVSGIQLVMTTIGLLAGFFGSIYLLVTSERSVISYVILFWVIAGVVYFIWIRVWLAIWALYNFVRQSEQERPIPQRMTTPRPNPESKSPECYYTNV